MFAVADNVAHDHVSDTHWPAEGLSSQVLFVQLKTQRCAIQSSFAAYGGILCNHITGCAAAAATDTASAMVDSKCATVLGHNESLTGHTQSGVPAGYRCSFWIP